MSGHAEASTAGDVYAVTVEPPGRSIRKRVGAIASGLFLAAIGEPGEGGVEAGASAGDVVVRRRTDDVEVLRVRGGPPDELSWTRQHVDEQLGHLSPEEFRQAWGLA